MDFERGVQEGSGNVEIERSCNVEIERACNVERGAQVEDLGGLVSCGADSCIVIFEHPFKINPKDKTQVRLGCRVQGSGFRVQGSGCRGWGWQVESRRRLVREHPNMKRFRGGLVFKAHRLVYHSTLGLRVMKKKKKFGA